MQIYDILVWGASGFTGRLVAEYLYRQYGSEGELRWALGGRNQQKLEAVRTAIGASSGNLDVQVADAADLEALRQLVKLTRVVCSTVGPYAQYGSSLVQACAEEGVDYCDLTGEVHWMRHMIDQHGPAAKKSGARIVHTCGFDSIPSDMGVLFVQAAMLERYGVYANHVKYRAKDFKGGFSGGTAASMLNMMEEAEHDPSINEIMQHPYALNPVEDNGGLDGPDRKDAFYDEDFSAWAAPFMMAGINTRVVRRTQALMDHPYGHDFRYDEATLMKDGPMGAVSALALSLATSAMMSANAFGPARRLFARLLPSPGEGPDETARENGFFKIAVLAKHPTDASKNLLAYVDGDKDPGYGSTAKMLAESAICLAKDGLNTQGGFWTPASAMGSALIRRLHDNAGVKFTVASQ